MGNGRGRHPVRIHIKPPNEEVSKRYLLVWSRKKLYHNPQSFPLLSSSSTFGNNNPLELDIGCATGEFICSRAAQQRQRNFLAVDVSLKPLYRAIKHSEQRDLDNIKFIRTDVRLLYPLFPKNSLHKVYLHFPIPVITHADRKHAIFTPQFLDGMSVSLDQNGVISCMTDMKEYYDTMRCLADSDKRFFVREVTESSEFTDPAEKSYYHTVWENQGRSTYRFVMIKR